MVRLKDIAAQAGVSVMTVSKVLRDAPDISAATKARIRRLAQQMDYVPDSMAQSLRNRTTKMFGLVISAATNPIFARVVMAIEEEAYKSGYDLILAHSMNIAEREDYAIRRLMARRVDGLFISPLSRLETKVTIYEELARRGINTVILGQRMPFCAQFVGVEIDDFRASLQITQHLIELGHRRIAFLAGSQVWPYARERLEGYRQALRNAGIDWDDRLVFNAGSTIEEGERAAMQMAQESPKATAVQAVNDLVAIGAGNVLLNQGIRIPQDLSLAGFGDVLASEYFRIPLTTVRQPKMRLGLAAAESMQQLLRGERPESKRLAADLVVRASTGPVPRGK